MRDVFVDVALVVVIVVVVLFALTLELDSTRRSISSISDSVRVSTSLINV